MKNLMCRRAAAVLCCVAAISACSKSDVESGQGRKLPGSVNQDVLDLINQKGHESPWGHPVDEVYNSTDIAAERSEVGMYNNEESGTSCYGYEVTTTTKVSATENMDAFMLLNGSAFGNLYPGALVQGKSVNGGGIPDIIPIVRKRLPGNIILNIVSGVGTGKKSFQSYKVVDVMNQANVNQAMNDLLYDYMGADGKGSAATTYSITQIYNNEQLTSEVGLNVNAFGATVSSTFNIKQGSSSKYMLVKLIQPYFTMTYDCPDASLGVKGVFSDDITVDDLSSYTGPGNPICYVSSVTYGRYYYLLYETTHSVDSLKTYFRASYSKVSAFTEVETQRLTSDLRVTCLQLGGSASDGLASTDGDPQKVRDFIDKGAEFSTESVGAPLSYKLALLKDNSTVNIPNTLDYTYSTKTFVADRQTGNFTLYLWNVELPVPYVTRDHGHLSMADFVLDEVKVSRILDGKVQEEKVIRDDKPYYFTGADSSLPLYDRYKFNFGSRTEMEKYIMELSISGTINTGSTWGAAHMNERCASEKIVLQEIFEYDSKLNKWVVAQKGRTADGVNNPYNCLGAPYRVGEVEGRLKLNYQLKCDGYIHVASDYTADRQ